jgi:hypothetical protein
MSQEAGEARGKVLYVQFGFPCGECCPVFTLTSTTGPGCSRLRVFSMFKGSKVL